MDEVKASRVAGGLVAMLLMLLAVGYCGVTVCQPEKPEPVDGRGKPPDVSDPAPHP